MNVHGLCGKAGSDLCRIFHAESLGVSPHNEEKTTNRKKIYLKSAAGLKAIQARVTYTISVCLQLLESFDRHLNTNDKFGQKFCHSRNCRT